MAKVGQVAVHPADGSSAKSAVSFRIGFLLLQAMQGAIGSSFDYHRGGIAAARDRAFMNIVRGNYSVLALSMNAEAPSSISSTARSRFPTARISYVCPRSRL